MHLEEAGNCLYNILSDDQPTSTDQDKANLHKIFDDDNTFGPRFGFYNVKIEILKDQKVLEMLTKEIIKSVQLQEQSDNIFAGNCLALKLVYLPIGSRDDFFKLYNTFDNYFYGQFINKAFQIANQIT